jgi:nucleoside-triphosphatase THEP1
MIIIIRGPINSGKTSCLEKIKENSKNPYGFLIKKAFHCEIYIGQYIFDIRTGKSVPFTYIEGFLPENTAVWSKYMSYCLTLQGYKFADSIVENAIKEAPGVIIADEFGPMELDGKGLWPLFENLLRFEKSNDTRLYISIRDECYEEAAKKMKLKDRELTEIKV